MIPFFRKIRKKMADDNRPLKYIRYAIGEIVLVVIGILIALQINTWNEERKDRIVEKDILLLLRRELKTNLRELEVYKKEAEQDNPKILLYETYFKAGDNNPNKDSVAEFITSVFWGRTYFVDFNIINSLLNTSRINYITNEELKFYLNKLSTSSKILKEFFSEARREFTDKYLYPNLSTYFYIENAIAYKENTLAEGKKLYADNVGEAFSKIEINNMISNLIRSNKDAIVVSTWNIGIMKDALAVVEEDLKKYDDLAVKPFYGRISIIGPAAKGWDESVPLDPVDKNGVIWQGVVKLKDSTLVFINRNSWTISWGGNSFPKGELMETNDEFKGEILAKEGTYKVIVNLSDNTYEFIKQDD